MSRSSNSSLASSAATGEHPDDRVCTVGDGVRLCYRTCGDPDHPALVLIAGLGQQLIVWPEPLCRALAERGYHVIRFDNRDVGRSSRSTAPRPSAWQFVSRRWNPRQYSLEDIARDAAGLIESLELAPAHLVGMSMGGMIAQTVASYRPDLVASLVSIMSTTGASGVGRPAPSTWLRMLRRPRPNREAAVASYVAMMRHIGSHGFPFDAEATHSTAIEAWERGDGQRAPAGVARQLAAIFKSGDRSAAVAQITTPTLIVHGNRDRMVHPSGGRATAEAIPGATLKTIAGMGLDLPAGAWPRLVDLIAEHCQSPSAVSDA